MKTEVTELLGIEYPIIQGGMAWVAEYHLAAGVSNAGGLGLIGAASAPAEWVREQIREAKKLTDKPFGVNIMLISPYAEDVAKVVAEEGVKVVTTGAGSPEKYMKMWKEAGIKVIPVVASVALARRMERCGADAVVAEGCESGGHIGENTTMVLVPQIVDAVKIPVIAAGGIADGRGIAAAFMLGADGKCPTDKEFVFYGNLAHPSESVKHMGDNLTGEGEGDDEQIQIDLSKVPANIERIAFTVTIYEAEARRQNFGQVSNSFIRLVDETTGKEMIRYDLGEDFSIETAVVVGELYRHNGEWKFNAIGSGFQGGLAALCGHYGIEVA